MATETVTNYNEDSIKTLEDVVHIRKRPGMYIGRLGDGSNAGDGIYVLLKEVIDNCIDEFAMGYGKNVIVKVGEDGEVCVRDFGRGIPLGKLTHLGSEQAEHGSKVRHKGLPEIGGTERCGYQGSKCPLRALSHRVLQRREDGERKFRERKTQSGSN